jgi:hypothetical protein
MRTIDDEQVQQADRPHRPWRNLIAVAAAVLLVGGVVAARASLPRADEVALPAPASTPLPSALADGPPPATFKAGTTVLLLQGEIPVIAVKVDPKDSYRLIVEPARDADTETCLPHLVVRILARDANSVRIAAYRYAVAPNQTETVQCLKPGGVQEQLRLDLSSPVGGRKILAGSTGNRSVLN